MKRYYGSRTGAPTPPPVPTPTPTPTPTPSSAAPINSTLPVITGTTTKGQLLSTSSGSWLNTPTAFSYQWKRDATAVGIDAPTYTLVLADLGGMMTCIVTASNAAGLASATSPARGPVVDIPPANTVPPILTGTPTEGQVLSVSPGSWNNSPTSYSYIWNRNGIAITGAPNLSTYTLVSADVGANITCSVTATNSGGSNSAVSNALGPVGGIVGPANLTVPELSGVPRSGEAFWFSSGTWSGGAITSYTYKIYRDGVLANTYTQAADTYAGTWAAGDVGTVITATVTATNSAGTSSPVNARIFYAFASDVITPATITTPTAARTSSSGTTPMVATVTADVYDSYVWNMQIGTDATFASLVYDGLKGVAEYELTSPFVMDISGTSAPPWVPAVSAIGATQYVRWRLVSADYFSGVGGVASSFSNSLSPTDAAVATFLDASTITSANVLLSNGNLTVKDDNGGATVEGVKANKSIAVGTKVYFEAKIENNGSYRGIGVMDPSATFATLLGNDAVGHAVAVWPKDGNVEYKGGVWGSGFTGAATNDYVGIAVDNVASPPVFYSRIISGGVAGAWHISGNPVAGTGGAVLSGASGALTPAWSAQFGGSTNTVQTTFNFGVTSYQAAAPSGFGNL